jgi:sugar O-acyltransferase (sialic acid O-acetyltransferase NeuD family)
MENNIILYGASGHCKVIIDVILSRKKHIISHVVDDNSSKKFLCGYKVIFSNDFKFDKNIKYFIAIGNNQVRKKIAKRLNLNFEILTHKNAYISSNDVILGEGTVIMVHAIINPSVSIGKHCIINSGTIIEHDCKIEDFVHICPGASLAGGVEVGEGSMVGIGSTVIQGIKIGKWATIGAGTVIVEDVPDFAVVVGVPGKIIKYLENEQ